MGVAEINERSKELIIHSVFFFYGNAANDQLSVQIAKDMSDHWNAPAAEIWVRSKLYQVKFRIEGIWARSLTAQVVIENLNPYHNFFRIEEYSTGNISFVDGIGSNTGYFQYDNLLNNSTTAAHEYGHTLGLKHPHILDLRGSGQPAIMYPRGTLVDPEFQYEAAKPAGQPGGTINPWLRKVSYSDVKDLRLESLHFDKEGKAIIGGFTNFWHEAHSKE